MKVRVVGVTRGELPVPDVHRFVGLTLGPVGVEDNVLLGGDRMATQALARFEVVAKSSWLKDCGPSLNSGRPTQAPVLSRFPYARTSPASRSNTMRWARSVIVPLITRASPVKYANPLSTAK